MENKTQKVLIGLIAIIALVGGYFYFSQNSQYSVKTSGKSIVVFYNSWSRFNKENRIGTHAALYLGRERDIYLAEQYFLSQRAVPYSSLKKRGFTAKQILAPK